MLGARKKEEGLDLGLVIHRMNGAGPNIDWALQHALQYSAPFMLLNQLTFNVPICVALNIFFNYHKYVSDS